MEKRKGKSIIIFGIGSMGGWVLEFLARSKGIEKIIVADVNEEYGRMKVENAAIGAAWGGFFKQIEFRKIDVFDIDRTTDFLKIVNPDIIYSSMALPITLGAAFRLPSHIAKQWVGYMAITYPAHLVLIMKLMQAIKRADVNPEPFVISNSLPDIVNPILWKKGLGPNVGAGNIDNRVGEIKRRVSIEKNVPMNEIDVWMITEHAFMARGSSVPYFLKIQIHGKDCTEEINHKIGVSKLLSRYVEYNSDEGTKISLPMMASSAVKHIMAIINNTNEFSHAPGPNGLPGGYPIRINSKGVKIELPEGIAMEEAVKINTDAMKYEGVEEIKGNGTVVFTDEGHKAFKNVFGLEIKEIKFEDNEQVAKEMLVVYKKLIEK